MKLLIKKFLTKSFIVFCIIGSINTLIHLGIYNLYLKIINDNKISIIIATSIAFIIASIFSYWANATFTYHEKMQKRTMLLSFVTFIGKFFLNALLTYLFTVILEALKWDKLINIIPLFVTCILLPMQFLVFNVIFKKTNNSESS